MNLISPLCHLPHTSVCRRGPDREGTNTGPTCGGTRGETTAQSTIPSVAERGNSNTRTITGQGTRNTIIIVDVIVTTPVHLGLCRDVESRLIDTLNPFGELERLEPEGGDILP